MKNSNKTNIIKKLLKDTKGFSITELGIVLVIGALMMVPIYSLLFYVSDVKPTDKRIEIVQEALAEHLRVTGTLPCPAPLTANLTANQLTESRIGANCSAAGVNGVYANANTDAAASVFIGALPMQQLKTAVACGPDPAGGVWAGVTTALKDTIFSVTERVNGDATRGGLAAGVTNTTSRAEGVRCPLNEYAMDTNGVKFIYAVSANATQVDFDPFAANGNVQIRVGNRAGNTVNSLYALVSLGEDASGGFDGAGLAVGGACPNQNCDFVTLAPNNAANITNIATFVTNHENLTNGAAYFDDKVEYGIARFLQEDSKWRWGSTDAGGANRHIVVDNQSALLIGASAVNDAQISNSDSLIIKQGAMQIDGNLNVSASGTTGLQSANAINVGDKIKVANKAKARHFCYPSSQSITAQKHSDRKCPAEPEGSGGIVIPSPSEPIMGLPECPAGSLNESNIGCARLLGTDKTKIQDVGVYAGKVPGLEDDFFVARCDNGMTYNAQSDKCVGVRQALRWKKPQWNESKKQYYYTDSGLEKVVHNTLKTASAASNGLSNSSSIANNEHPAANACRAMGKGWYLPAVAELEKIYSELVATDDPDHPYKYVKRIRSLAGINKGTTGILRDGFNTGRYQYYWSSSEYTAIKAWLVTFYSGTESAPDKSNQKFVRCANRGNVTAIETPQPPVQSNSSSSCTSWRPEGNIPHCDAYNGSTNCSVVQITEYRMCGSKRETRTDNMCDAGYASGGECD